jgi:polysaccharide export outer membrane protein
MRSQASTRGAVIMLLLASSSLASTAQQIAASDAKGVRAGAGGSTEVATRSDLKNTREPAAHASQFTIGVADVIRVNVWKNSDLSQTVTVDPDGFVSLPLLGDVNVVGLNANQLATLLTAKYASYVITPQVTVSVVDIRSREVFVMGQVSKAGSYPLRAPTTVLQLIAQAGGLTPYAKRKAIYVLRASNGHSEKFPFNYVKVTRGDGQQNIMLQPGDTVIVP